jgi:hypothetical protein
LWTCDVFASLGGEYVGRKGAQTIDKSGMVAIDANLVVRGRKSICIHEEVHDTRHCRVFAITPTVRS